MSGIAGIIVFIPVNDVENIVKRMSTTLQHRGNESLYKFVQSTDSTQGVLISIREIKQNSVTVDSSPIHLHIIDSSYSFTERLKIGNLENIETFNTLSIQIDPRGMRVFRSIDGTCGFYYTQYEGGIIFASEKKSIWAICRNQVKSLDPGCTLSITWDGKKDIIKSNRLSRPSIDRSISRPAAIQSLEKSLFASFSHLKDSHNCGVLFSGGVDSALASLLTKKHCKDTLLMTAVCECSHDEEAAIRAAELIDWTTVMVKIDDEALWNALPEVIYYIESSERMQVEIALPFFFAAGEAKRRGVHQIISGQGPDELFAGYARHEKIMEEQGCEAVEETLWNEVSATHEMNIQRDVRTIAAHGLDVFFPYLYPPFIRAALSLPATLKVDSCNTPSRKIIFRELAEHLGLPHEIAMAPKRATQYSSGTSKLLSTTILERVESRDKSSRRIKNSMIQDVLDAIAIHLKMPIARNETDIKVDLEPTERLMKRLRTSSPCD
jgi:asparagine synthetase B (glutamine-hydrolysing)